MRIQVTGEAQPDNINVTGGHKSTVIEVSNSLGGLSQADGDTRYVKKTAIDWITPDTYLAVGDGITDDKAAIQSALNACPMGGVVYLGARKYGLSGKLRIPPYVALLGGLPDRDGNGDGTAALLPLPGFTDAMVLEFVDQATGGYATTHRDTMLSRITIDGRLLTTEAVVGIRATGYVHGVQLHDVSIHKVTGHGIEQLSNGSGHPYSWYLDNVQITGSGSVTTWDGFHFLGTDHQLNHCRTLGVRGHGYYFAGGANNQLVGCRAEWSAKSGYYLTGSWGTGQGSGGMIMTGCSTDRNSEYGILIDATGNAPVVINGFMARRDGRNGFPGTGGGSFAALRGTNATTPIIATGFECYPGVNDDNTGVNSPERGVSFGGCTWVSISDGYLHAATTPFHDAGTNTVLLRGPNVGTATGTTASPTRASLESWNWRGTASAANSTDVSAVASTNTVGGGNSAPHYSGTSATAGSSLIRAQVTGESVGRFEQLVNGTMAWGSGSATRDVNWKRQSAAVVGTDNNLQATVGLQIGSTTTDYGGGVGVIGLKNAATAPTTNPTNGVVLYAEGGTAKVRRANGTVATLGQGVAGARYVASNGATAAEKAKADYICDGTADDVEINAAVAAAKAEGGGRILLSPGNFNISAPIAITGNKDENDPRTIILQGCGTQVTELTVAANVNGITITDWAQVNISDIGIFISGSGKGIVSTGVNNVANSNNVSFWHSSFRNLRINGGFVATDTVWGMELGMPWRSVFENIEIEGCRNGIKVINNATMQNAGDCVFSRFFVEIVGTGGYALYVDSIDGNMNQNTWIDFEAGANSTGCTGIWLGGTAGTASQRFIGNLNLEQFQTLINVANGNSNVFDCNFITTDTGGVTNKGFVTGTNSYNNTFRAAYFNIAGGDTVQVIEDANTTSNAPNIFERIRIENNTSGTVTYSTTASTVLRDITTFNTGNTLPAGLLRYPLSTVNNPTFRPDDHGLITWTDPPTALSGAGFGLTAGQVYLSKFKIVDRATVISNIKYLLTVAQAGGTSGQNFVGLYNSSGTLLIASGDQTTNFSTTGEKTAAITPQTLAVGTYYVGFLANHSTTAPSVAGGGGNSALNNVGLTAGTARFLNTGAGNTALPASITLASQSVNTASRWAGLL